MGHTNEITFNILSAGDILNSWGHLDISGVADYTIDEEIFRLKLLVKAVNRDLRGNNYVDANHRATKQATVLDILRSYGILTKAGESKQTLRERVQKAL